jgi:hypothetical protein
MYVSGRRAQHTVRANVKHVFLGLAGLVVALPGAARSPLATTPQSAEFEKDVRPFLAAYCFSCHGPKKQKAKLDLSTARGEKDLERAQDAWAEVLKQLRGRAMPPEDAPKQPSEVERQKIVAWLEAAMRRIDDRAPRNPGRVTLRRLNRAEYNNTVRDLLGLDLRPADDFPADDVSDGFDTLGDVLTLPPLLLDKYLDAADRILDRALVLDGPAPILERTLEAEAHEKARVAAGVAEMALEREFGETIEVPAEGRYEVRVRAGQDRSPEGVAVVVLKVDGVDLAVLRVTAPPGRPEEISASIPLQAGARRFSVRHSPTRAYDKKEVQPETRLFLDRVRIAGPERSLSHRRIFFAEGTDRAAARAILERFATRAFRRPARPDEVDRLLGLYDRGRAQGKDFPRAVRLGLWSVLVSPHFLFRVERDTPRRDAWGAVALDDWELASRLSYFLWSSMPDQALLDRAAKGLLREPAHLVEEMRRMLADPKSEAFVENFALQWLGLRKLEAVQPDRDLFPQFTEALRRAMLDEARLFFAHVLREDRSILDFVDADYTFLNETLARHYGVKGVPGAPMRRVGLPDRTRGGVLTMAAVLTATSHPTRTSAVKRGKWILEEILGAPPPPPPPNVPELEESLKNRPDAKTLTLRKRLEIHRADPNCYDCHKRMDVLGLGLENFDPLGRWRDKDAGQPIDASGTLPGGESFKTPAELKKILAASRDEFARTLTEKVFVYALGRRLEGYDRREVTRVVESMMAREYRLSALLEGVVTSYPFRFRKAASP